MLSSLLSRRWLQFRLRTLLLGTFLAAVACCWFTPFTHEVRRADGSLQARYRVRRAWNGDLVASGEQWEFYDNGKPERRWIQLSGPPGSECDGENCTHWDADGRSKSLGEKRFDHLIWLITHTIVPDAWTDNGGQGSISGFETHCFFDVQDDTDSEDEHEDLAAFDESAIEMPTSVDDTDALH